MFEDYRDVFDSWMYMLSRKKPRSITIKFLWGNYYKIPWSLFSISDLEYLYLKRCVIGLPQEFEGFKRLSVLNLKYFSSTDSDINNLISSCPLLNTLRLKYFEGISCLRIQAQTLQLLEVEWNFEDLHLHAPNLLYLTLNKTEAQQSDAVAGDKKNYLKQSFVGLNSIEELTISGPFLTYLSEGCLLTELRGVFDHPRKICIGECFWHWTEVSGACSIFRNATMLRELEIQSFSRPDKFWCQPIWNQDQTEIEEPTLHHLVTVTINGFVGLEYEVDLVGLLLRWSPALEELKIVREDEDVQNDECMCKALTKLLALPRVSNKAKIIVI